MASGSNTVTPSGRSAASVGSGSATGAGTDGSGTAETTTNDEPFNGLIFVEHWHEELLERVPLP